MLKAMPQLSIEHQQFSLVLVCHSYPPVLGGSEIEAQRVCSALLRRGHRVRVLCAGGAPMPDETEWIDSEGVPVRIFGGRLSPRMRDYAYALGGGWCIIHKRREYQIVYFLMSGLHTATAMPVVRYLTKPMVMKFSGSNTIRQMAFSWLGRLELSFIGRWTRHIMILNEGMTEEAREVGLDTRKLMWMPNPVNTDEFRPATKAMIAEFRERLKLPAGVPLVIYVGRLAPEKELPSLLAAFAEVVREYPNALLALVGEGPSRPALEEQARRLSIVENLRFVGMVPVAEVPRWLQAADIFTLVSSLEGLPCSLIEAMAVGLPSVVSNIPANLQLVDSGVHGLVAPVKDEAALADRLKTLLRDPELMQRMGRNARARVIETYSTDTVIARYEELFRGLVPPSIEKYHTVC